MSTSVSHYPRPKMRRENWLNLNGIWQFELNTAQSPIQDLAHTIQVPFCVESKASGLGWRVEPHHFMHYRKCFSYGGSADQRILLHFGAVDQVIDVFINHYHIVHHVGGYASFSMDITKHASSGDNEIYCVVNDKTECSPLTRGKQRLNNKGAMSNIFYPPTSGIWQTVWLEFVPVDYIQDLIIVPDYDQQTVSLNIKTNRPGQAKATVSYQGKILLEETIETNRDQILKVPEMHSWSPEYPHLYDVEIQFQDDSVATYFAMRKISVISDSKGIKRFALNNKPYFMSGVLDQGYWPTSLLTPPHDQALEIDITTMKEAGFNTLRKHVKVEAEHYYYLCDTLGMLVWQDMPNGGADYNFKFVTYLPNISDFLSRRIRDHHYRIFKRNDETGRRLFYQELEAMINQLRHYPSIVAWVPFNEGWGQFDARIATERIQSIDDTRLINEACGWFDQGGGDMHTYHSYFKPFKVRPKNRVVALTEFGGQALAVEGHTTTNQPFGYKMLDQEIANDALEKLIESKVTANIAKGLSASIYTQLSDVESEVNGLMTYDREVFKFDKVKLQALNRRILELFAAVAGY